MIVVDTKHHLLLEVHAMMIEKRMSFYEAKRFR